MHLAPFGEYMPFARFLAGAGITQFVSIPGGFDSGVVLASADLSRPAARLPNGLLRIDFSG